MRKLAGDSSLIKNDGVSSSPEQSAIDNDSRELLDEISHIQSRLGAQEHDFERVRMELHNLREENTIEARYKEKHFEEKSQNTVAEKEVFEREQELLRRQPSENEAKHQLEMQMMAEQIEKLKKEAWLKAQHFDVKNKDVDLFRVIYQTQSLWSRAAVPRVTSNVMADQDPFHIKSKWQTKITAAYENAEHASDLSAQTTDPTLQTKQQILIGKRKEQSQELLHRYRWVDL